MDNMTGYRNNPDFVAAGQAARLMCPHCRGLIAPEQKRELNNQGIWLREGERAAADGSITEPHETPGLRHFGWRGQLRRFQTWNN